LNIAQGIFIKKISPIIMRILYSNNHPLKLWVFYRYPVIINFPENLTEKFYQIFCQNSTIRDSLWEDINKGCELVERTTEV